MRQARKFWALTRSASWRRPACYSYMNSGMPFSYNSRRQWSVGSWSLERAQSRRGPR